MLPLLYIFSAQLIKMIDNLDLILKPKNINIFFLINLLET